ncbi:hypothetical protein BP5796_00696 [Coleophoma crateriformis]|uniref:Rhodopsin domain-containing protein n=1 Tax=Coleophoma crateriformis TaxID=565419 RepID=A0A3D8T8P1_9HELO|nr:hypothetical protein BP5796_00696 [Coleophoma crateriformis]
MSTTALDPSTIAAYLAENRQNGLRVTNVAIVVVAVVFVGLRDFCLLWQHCIKYGLGKHAASVAVEQRVIFAKLLMSFECIYVVGICCTKISLLLMYWRIFPMRSIKIGSYILGSITIGWAFSIIMASIFQCIPMQKTWTPNLPGRCTNLKASLVGNAIPNILTDVAILALPMPHVWSLHASLLHKAQLSVVFLLGSFVVITSIYRFTTLFAYRRTDPTWTLSTAEIWSVVEAASGIISACLPTLGPLFQCVTRVSGIRTLGQNVQMKSGHRLKTNDGRCSTSQDRLNRDSGPKTGGGPFRRLYNEMDLRLDPLPNSKVTSSICGQDMTGGERTTRPEVPPKGIMIRTEVEWDENRTKTPDPLS